MEDILWKPQLPILVIMAILYLGPEQGLVKPLEIGTTNRQQHATEVMKNYQCIKVYFTVFSFVSINVKGKR